MIGSPQVPSPFIHCSRESSRPVGADVTADPEISLQFPIDLSRSHREVPWAHSGKSRTMGERTLGIIDGGGWKGVTRVKNNVWLTTNRRME